MEDTMAFATDSIISKKWDIPCQLDTEIVKFAIKYDNITSASIMIHIEVDNPITERKARYLAKEIMLRVDPE
jgi:hypothetical protein